MGVPQEKIDEARSEMERQEVFEVHENNISAVNLFLGLKMAFEIAPNGQTIYTGIDRGSIESVAKILGINADVETFSRLLVLEAEALNILNSRR